MKKHLIITLTIFLMAITLCGAVSAAADPADVKYVSTTGSDDNNGNETNPYLTIGKGITSVNSNGTVNVADGTYYERLVISKNVNLVGQSQENTILDGNNTGRPITINSGANVSISLFTIQNGVSGFSGGGIDNYGTVTVNNNTFINNSATYGGAIFNAYGSTLNVSESTFTGNNGIFGGGAIYDAEGTSTVTGSTFNNNLASYGGAIYTYGTVTVSDSTFTGNNATNYGGAIYNHAGGTMSVTDSSFTGNNANTYGGAIHNSGSVSSVYVTDSSLTGNTAQHGGGIFNYYGTVSVSGSTISDNAATYYHGGGIENYFGTVSVSDSFITGNTALNSGGGGIINDGGTMTVSGSTISGNTALFGGGIWNYYGTLTVNFNRIVDNSPTAIHNDYGSFDAEYNWWGSNNPDFTTLIVGVVDYNPWLYMTLQTNPTNIVQGEASTLTASFNNAFDGTTVTPLNPDNGHIPDKTPVTFNTDLGSVGSKTINKETINGTATATLTADETTGIAHVNAVSDNQTVNTNVNIQSISPTAKANIKGGLFNVNKNVYLSMNKPGTIYYTLNGSTPTNASTKYTGYLTISSTTTLRFIGVDLGGNVSPVYTEKYLIDKTAPKVVSSYPKNLKAKQSRTATLYLKFSENLKSSTYWSKIYVKDLKTGKKVSITKWIKGNILYIKTKYKRASLRSYQAYVPYNAVKDYAGNNLVKTYSYKFKTRG